MSTTNTAEKRLQKVVDGKTIVPVSQLIGFKLVSFEYGKATFILEADTKHHNPMGTIHGGIYCDIADAAMGVAFSSTLQPNELFGTVSFQINFLKSLSQATLRAEGYLVKKGRSIGFLESKIYTADNELIATAQSTCKITTKK